MNYTIPVTKEKANEAILKVINCFLELTKFEIKIISTMLDNDIKYLNPKSRMKLRRLIGKSPAMVNNYIKRLKDKKILVESSDGLVLNKSILIPIEDKEINIKFNVN